jgi:hypothetical protein
VVPHAASAPQRHRGCLHARRGAELAEDSCAIGHVTVCSHDTPGWARKEWPGRLKAATIRPSGMCHVGALPAELRLRDVARIAEAVRGPEGRTVTIGHHPSRLN